MQKLVEARRTELSIHLSKSGLMGKIGEELRTVSNRLNTNYWRRGEQNVHMNIQS
jgi:hypothetical protein